MLAIFNHFYGLVSKYAKIIKLRERAQVSQENFPESHSQNSDIGNITVITSVHV